MNTCLFESIEYIGIHNLFYGTIFTILDTGKCFSDTYLMCDNNTRCIHDKYICNGHIHCQDGQDENIGVCKSRNAFPKAATVQCFEDNRPDKYRTVIMAIPCDGRRECKDGEDEMGCDISLIYLLIALLIGFATISVVAGLFDNHHKRVKKLGNIEQGSRREDLPFQELHQDIDRANKIAFYQGAKDRRQQNQALITSESSFHGNFATGMLCLKASTVIAVLVCSLDQTILLYVYR